RGRASVSFGARRPTTAGSCLRLRAASSSQPGRSAWRAGARASPGERLQAGPPQDATPRPALRLSPETPLDEQGWESYTLASVRSQDINAICSRTLQGIRGFKWARTGEKRRDFD